jgi:hypothetical protein
MPGNPLVRFDEGRVGRIARCRPLSYSTVKCLGLLSKTMITPSRQVAKKCSVISSISPRDFKDRAPSSL